MLYNVKFRLTSQFLGSKNTSSGIRRFRRVGGAASDQKEDLMLLEEDVWRWAMQDAVESLGLEIDTGRVNLPPGIRLGSIFLFDRHYKTKATQYRAAKDKTAKHEMIRAKSVLSFKINISGPRPGDHEQAPAPTIGELEKIFNHIGEYIGLSPFGNHFGYGRFYVHSISLVTPNDAPDL